ncbi:phage antirepressor N-terminal domain-containing protein [Chryseobacterium terrae]|uniref:Phage antirepressor N-terminal domain-containing protein n=1 Tax=Chryseobacterium terrae TaxID=3163299 RepID=A0ABW8Y6R9_9FLAO
MKSNKFLQFNGKTIFFQSYDGNFWIALKPICEVLNVNYNRVFQNLKTDKIFSQLFAIQQMVGADNRLRNMVCLPEKFIYGWICSLQSDSEDLQNYKLECYEVLFNYFHGTITGRKELLKQKVEIDVEISKAENELMQTEAYKTLIKLGKQKQDISKGLKNNDQKATEEIKDLFNYQNS